MAEVKYGPLAALMGTWKGTKGLDVAPEPEGEERTPYYETLIFTPVGDVTNAESQLLAVVHYRQQVFKQSNHEVIHDETGYWMWDEQQQTLMHSLLIPRGVSVLAGGVYTEHDSGAIELEVKAYDQSSEWPISQSVFMQQKARTVSYYQKIVIENERLSYQQTMMLDIYGKSFEHVDSNQLLLQP